ncbi:MAG: hypothetical protein KGY67_08935, partial [Candidatus Thermoplasmatota archaeon]|nr:hypothetical protein [Candidatus Thermoplasmatota archaeon]
MKKLFNILIFFILITTTITIAHPLKNQQDNFPPEPPIINGPNEIKIKTEETFTFSTTDPDEDELYYLIEWGDGTYADNTDYSSLKIAPPPSGGMYIGQYEWMPGDIETFEEAIDRKVAWFSPYGI